MDFFEELEWRGMLHDMTPGAIEQVRSGMQTAYIGFDPTAPSITIGNYVQVMMLTLWQQSGHKPIVLMGGATGRIGDPSGKDAERQLKTFEELDNNLAHQENQFAQYLEFGNTGNQAKMLNNLDFYKEMNVLDFLRDIGKTLTINYMLSKDSVKNRIETGMSFTEFSYQLLQAYDFQYLYTNENCHFQIGGSDQWGNITSGTEFIRRNLTDAKAYAVTSKLLKKADGKKFGKSEQGNLWLDPELTSPYQFYQFWINADDADLPSFTRYFTLKSRAEIEAMEADLQDDPRERKRILAEELTKRIHGNHAYEAVAGVSEILFNKKLTPDNLKAMNAEVIQMVSKELPSFNVPIDVIKDGIPLEHLLTVHSQIFNSLSECRRAVKNNAVSLNKVKITDSQTTVTPEDILQDRYIMVENGKKNKFILDLN
ncbi:MAG: tyrosine--tRNA ligase [Saprospiraceae bacterium]|nr:tyrosine--tRNA ligase [Saprospiraceae bacterium]